MPPDHHVWQLRHSTLCPFSRTVRLVLSERGLAYDLVEAVPENRIAAMRLGRDNRLPTLQDEAHGILLVGSYSICEYLEETASGPSMLLGSAEQRAEIRRLVAWAHYYFYEPAIRPALRKQLPGRESRQPRVGAEPARATASAEAFLDEIAYLLDHRAWLAGPALSLADLAIAAHLSVLDYFGAVDWTGHGQAQTWYSVIKSRRSFQPLLADRVDGIEPPPHIPRLIPEPTERGAQPTTRQHWRKACRIMSR